MGRGDAATSMRATYDHISGGSDPRGTRVPPQASAVTALPPVPATPPIVVHTGSQEVTLHELGASVAVAIADIQRELARYPSPLGAYVLDELEIALPIRTRIDDLGQTMVTVISPERDAPPPAMVRFRLRPAPGVHAPPPPAALPLSSLGILSPDVIARLHARRIFSVADFERVTATPAGVDAVSRLRLGVPVTRVVDRVHLLALPNLPTAVAAMLVTAGIHSLAALARANPAKLAADLSRLLENGAQPAITADAVGQWQRGARDVIVIPIPPPRAPAR